MEQIELFETSIEYMGIYLSHDVEIKPTKKKVGLLKETMDEVKYKGKIIGYVLVEKRTGDGPIYSYSWVDPNSTACLSGPAYSDAGLAENLNFLLKMRIQKYFAE